MSKVKPLVLAVFEALLLLAGCAEQQIPEDRRQKSELRVEHRVSSIEYRVSSIEEVMQIAEDVLAKMRFTIEKADAESGLVRTRPLPGAQFFEFWRSDNVGAFNCAEANLHSTRRVVELNISQKDGTVCIGCDVKVYRLSVPEHHVSSSARAYEMFSESSSLLQVIRLNPEQEAAMAWVNLGRDRQLETEILKRISSILNKVKF